MTVIQQLVLAIAAPFFLLLIVASAFVVYLAMKPPKEKDDVLDRLMAFLRRVFTRGRKAGW